MNAPNAIAWPRWWERAGVVLFLLVIIVFGVLVEFRAAMLARRFTDLGCYLRAAWAVRTDGDLYDVVDDNGWHYNYPPLFAILMAPLADPPYGADRAGMLPYPASVAIWYAFSVLCLAGGVHWLASALESTSAAPVVRAQPAGTRRWWALRLVPVLACLPAIGHTLSRGQVNLLILLLLCGTAALLLRGRSGWAGLCLAGAACIKVIPAFLVLYPLWRRDWRCVTTFASGLVLGLAVIPLAVFGPERAFQQSEKFVRVLLGPALGMSGDKSRQEELLKTWRTDTQAPLAVLHNTFNPATRLDPPPPWVRQTHWAIGGGLTLLTLLAAGGRRRSAGLAPVLFLGALILPMLLLSPVCHRHYFALAVPLVMGMIAVILERRTYPDLGVGFVLLLVVYAALNTVTLFDGMDKLIHLGMGMYAALLLWLVGCFMLWRRGRSAPRVVSLPENVSRLAA